MNISTSSFFANSRPDSSIGSRNSSYSDPPATEASIIKTSQSSSLVARSSSQSNGALAVRSSTLSMNEGEQQSRASISTDQKDKQQALEDRRVIAELSARDREVRAHEQAHAAVGGQYAGAPSYQYERGPDGVNYAVGGEVRIDVSRAATPQDTIVKAQIITRAALAPAEPSPQDRKVAARASQLEAQARTELRSEQIESKDDDVSSVSENIANDNDSARSKESAVQQGMSEATTQSSAQPDSADEVMTLRSRSAQFLAISAIESSRSGTRVDQVA